MGDRRLRLQLVLDLDSEPVCGHVGLADAQPHGFTGYASLIATLQLIRAEGSGGSDGAAGTEGQAPGLAGQVRTSGDGLL
jgi:hypothetical protein